MRGMSTSKKEEKLRKVIEGNCSACLHSPKKDINNRCIGWNLPPDIHARLLQSINILWNENSCIRHSDSKSVKLCGVQPINHFLVYSIAETARMELYGSGHSSQTSSLASFWNDLLKCKRWMMIKETQSSHEYVSFLSHPSESATSAAVAIERLAGCTPATVGEMETDWRLHFCRTVTAANHLSLVDYSFLARRYTIDRRVSDLRRPATDLQVPATVRCYNVADVWHEYRDCCYETGTCSYARKQLII